MCLTLVGGCIDYLHGVKLLNQKVLLSKAGMRGSRARCFVILEYSIVPVSFRLFVVDSKNATGQKTSHS